MSVLPLLLTLVAVADDADLAHRLQIHLSAAAQPWLVRHGRPLGKAMHGGIADVVFELEVNRRGGLTRVQRSYSSAEQGVDRVARSLFQFAPPLPRPPQELAAVKQNIPCLVHLQLAPAARRVDVAIACFPPGDFPELARRDDLELPVSSRQLFLGWENAARGDDAAAIPPFRQAVAVAPDWTFAAVTLAAALARQGSLDEARSVWLAAGKPRRIPPDLRRLLAKAAAAAAEPAPSTEGGGEGTSTDAAAGEETEVSSCERDEGEIFHHIKKSMPELARCIDSEQQRAPTAMLPSSLPVSFVIVPKGEVKGIAVEHRHFRTGELSRCVQRALTGRLGPCGGSNCPVQFELEVRSEKSAAF